MEPHARGGKLSMGYRIDRGGRVEAKRSPGLVTCLSGHRFPAFTIMLRRLGFTTVYNLNWGILYLILLEKRRRTSGPFSLTRSHRDANMRGRIFADLRRLYHYGVAGSGLRAA